MSLPSATPPHPIAAPPPLRPKPVGGVATAAMALLGAAGITGLIGALAQLRYRSAVGDVYAEAGDNSELALSRLVDADSDLYEIAYVLSLVVGLATVVVFLMWFRRLRANAEFLAPGGHRRAPGRAVSAWFFPVSNLWEPKQITDDVIKALGPAPPRLRGVVNAWWASWVGYLTLSVVTSVYASVGPDESDFTTYEVTEVAGRLDVKGFTDALRTFAACDIVVSLLSVVAAGLAIRAVHELSRAQDTRLGFGH
ncbi:DUF4328 domain-containing protein [Streptomyces sp. H39-S7]|uniref:DUF4328 domain-containing protein n=1 Tax=Streptomyces sp. H39-S7 TaxID=3004357 RepID=UPI0022AEC35B|nr:DUF4328 domain-containing protein [Streptomyces sp. H39-S7]MCZ4125182.1 DUF4328 domain-containing protein [Streptomyces sp. H39-S7]